MKIATSGQLLEQSCGGIPVKSSLIDHQAQAWLFKTDQMAYFLAQAALLAKGTQLQKILDSMTDSQRKLARSAQDGTWKQYLKS